MASDFVLRSYDSDRKYKCRFSYWYNRIKGIKGLLVPSSEVFTVPLEVFEAFICDSVDVGVGVIREFVDSILVPAMGDEPQWFAKNGCFSNKFDFQHCLTNPYKILDDFMAIQYASVCLDTGGVSEFVLRKPIRWDSHKTATIYNGMPLRPEFRVFYDFDTHNVMYSANYWDYNTVRPHLYDRTDMIVFDAVRDELIEAYTRNSDRVTSAVAASMRTVDLSGRWSVDVLMDERGQLWLIDMAIAERSTYWVGER